MRQIFGTFESIQIRKNGLSKTSAVDALQIRGIDQQRFIPRLGRVSSIALEEIVLAIAAVIEYP